jgi:endonuclease G
MNFNATGVTVLSISHGVFGNDGNSTWQLWVSNDNGDTYSKVGNTITSSSAVLQTVTFKLNTAGAVRLSIRKVSGGSNRINIDNIGIGAAGSNNTGNNNSDNNSDSNGNSDSGIGTRPVGASRDNSHLLLGNPSGAVASISSPTNYLMDQSFYALSYNNVRGTPNWVSWHLHSSDMGRAPRRDAFSPNDLLPSGWYRVDANSYSSSGFDRGHNCPSADRTSSAAANSSTFLMTNMIPQAPENNQKTWSHLEVYIRSLVKAGDEVYIIMGSYGKGGTGSDGGITKTIDNGHVTVPSNIWKVIVVLPEGNNDLSRITTATRVIAVNTPNTNNVSADWKTYRTSVDAIEAATGYDLLSSLPESIQQVIEAQIDSN